MARLSQSCHNLVEAAEHGNDWGGGGGLAIQFLYKCCIIKYRFNQYWGAVAPYPPVPPPMQPCKVLQPCDNLVILKLANIACIQATWWQDCVAWLTTSYTIIQPVNYEQLDGNTVVLPDWLTTSLQAVMNNMHSACIIQ